MLPEIALTLQTSRGHVLSLGSNLRSYRRRQNALIALSGGHFIRNFIVMGR